MPNTDLVANLVPKTRRYVNFIPAMGFFSRIFPEKRTAIVSLTFVPKEKV